MIKLYTEEEFKKCKSRKLLPLQCKNCHKIFFLSKHRIQNALSKKTGIKGDFCCNRCTMAYYYPPIIVKCSNCGKDFVKKASQIKKSKNHFCSQHCSGTYNNAHKSKGTRRSKLENWLEQKLTSLYPSLEFHFNRTDAINSELDIYIPSLKLAFELNGIFHYEPIYGDLKLESIQNNDNRKFQACIEKGIELCIIDTSKQKYFKEKTSIQFLKIIQNVIDLKLSNKLDDGEGFPPSEAH